MGNEASQQVSYGTRLDNDVKVSWKKVTNSNPFPGRDGHCAAAVGGKLYVFGGVLHSDGQSEENTETDDLLVFDLLTESWSKAVQNGDVPAARSSATMAAVENKLYLYGGLSQETGWFKDLRVYDTETNKWSIPETTGTSPSPRDKLASAVIKDEIHFFGGFGPQGESLEDLEEVEDDGDENYQDLPDDQEAAQFGWFNDLFIFNTVTLSWSNPMQMNLGSPTPRAAHSLCALGQHLVIFGGRDSEARKNDTRIFNTETRRWLTDLKLTGRQPEPRSFHTATTVGDRVVVLGGRGVKDQHFSDFHIFDTSSQQWLQPSVVGDSLPARGVHTATLVSDHLVLFGGSSGFSPEVGACTTFFNDTYMVKAADVKTGKALSSSQEENQENVSANVPAPSKSDKPAASKSDKPLTNEGSGDAVPMSMS